MKKSGKTVLLGALMCVLPCASASAAGIVRTYGGNPIPGGPVPAIALGVAVPPGYTTYYVSGVLPKPIRTAANGMPADFGDITTQTRSVLDQLKTTMARMGIGFGDVVAAHLYLAPNADFPAMNKVWGEEFGTAAQPNKPARAAFRANALMAPGALLEIEFIAAKKVP